jgi:hypothetical protein
MVMGVLTIMSAMIVSVKVDVPGLVPGKLLLAVHRHGDVGAENTALLRGLRGESAHRGYPAH